MPLTRKQIGDAEDKPMTMRQVTDNAVSCHGSDISSKSHARIARSMLLKAQIRERPLEQELELEVKDIVVRRRPKLLRAKSEIEMDKIDMIVEEQQRIKEEADLKKTVADRPRQKALRPA
ncbi:unnamed protein product [Echinostoma caproni]|uniref:MFAP1 domain-containing protein n=1 Tax=Echinostoma caproni TaxID=27848 RepID=A0A183B254_9TREM|nr:unnamed protein product [Echinostoma caproni]